MTDKYEYINQYYKVFAFDGMIIECDGKRGTVTGADGGHLLVRFDDRNFSVHVHPTWKMKYYYEDPPEAVTVDTCRWTYDEHYDRYETECRLSWYFIDGGTPEENHAKYCHGCGREIKVHIKKETD